MALSNLQIFINHSCFNSETKISLVAIQGKCKQKGIDIFLAIVGHHKTNTTLLGHHTVRNYFHDTSDISDSAKLRLQWWSFYTGTTYFEQ